MTVDRNAISKHMLTLGLSALAHATDHSMFYSTQNSKWAELSVLQAGHAAEILIKARIAQEHPLLIFEKLPKNSERMGLLDINQLYEQGRTIQYNALPNQLWATTGLEIPNRDKYDEFGKVRNAIQHFLPPDGVNFNRLVLAYIYDVIDPLIEMCWGLNAADYYEDYDGAGYLVEALVSNGIYFRISEGILSSWEDAELSWPENNPEYKEEMEKRLLVVKEKRG